MMKIDIMNKGYIHNYKNVTSISVQNDCNTMIITYINENGEEKHAVDDISEYMAINEEGKIVDSLQNG